MWHQLKPKQVQTEDQYQFCYRAALEYLSSFDHYTDNWQSGGDKNWKIEKWEIRFLSRPGTRRVKELCHPPDLWHQHSPNPSTVCLGHHGITNNDDNDNNDDDNNNNVNDVWW